ncbi:similar to Saccharomyces cerevisiae YHR033W Putative protein of unknown function [Maudiozyma saulgeensis]|uniref:Aspartate/glutamate/uridylate kinase domain-containing protein n=1 Tax=Maudiozyma saulgeensis TaxID=1789683 RepID=A0A1X7QYC2_9SACH|nr:similar to Saccharomyces cerevisiae YHR033W Putative protein of unknown function [Kazachstania saulgeensis]
MKPSTIVIKLGSSSLVNPDTREPRLSIMSKMVETVAILKRQGHKVVIVSSGGVAMGLNAMRLAEKPKEIAEIQAIAAIGQGRLISKWDMLFQEYEQEIAQILLTRNDILNWKQYKNAKNTILELLKMGVTPIVNENDTLSISEIEFGDNDTLSGVTAALIEADYLFLLTDVDCLYTNDPRIDPEAKPVITVDMDSKINPLKDVNTSSGSGSSVGTGGMKTKLIAADLATKAGVVTLVMRSEQPQEIVRIIDYMEKENFRNLSSDEEVALLNDRGLPLHTKFLAIDNDLRLENRQFWLLHGLVSKGSIIIDKDIYENIIEENNNNTNNLEEENENSEDEAFSIDYQGGLPASGIIDIQDTFHELDCVNLKIGRRLSNGELDPEFPLQTVGRARCNYTSTELNKIKGINRGESVTDFLGYSGSDSDEINESEHTHVMGHSGSEHLVNKLADGLHECCIASRENLAFTPV